MSDVTIHCVYLSEGMVKATMEIHTGILADRVVEKLSSTIYGAVKACVLEANEMADKFRAVKQN